jgi:hypothetical protein
MKPMVPEHIRSAKPSESHRLEDLDEGWFVGHFTPTLIATGTRAPAFTLAAIAHAGLIRFYLRRASRPLADPRVAP